MNRMEDFDAIHKRTDWLYEKHFAAFEAMRAGANRGAIASGALCAAVGFSTPYLLEATGLTHGSVWLVYFLYKVTLACVLLSFVCFVYASMSSAQIVPSHIELDRAVARELPDRDWPRDFAYANLNAIERFPAEHRRLTGRVSWGKSFLAGACVLLFLYGSAVVGIARITQMNSAPTSAVRPVEQSEAQADLLTSD